MNRFIHLHTHTVHTRGNSTLAVDALVRRTYEYGMSATAMVDSGTVAGFEEFTVACRKSGVRPIYGCGFYLAAGSHRAPIGRSHLVLLARNERGFQNLIRLDGRARVEGFHDGKAHIDDQLLASDSDGLVCLTGGLGGDIDKLLVVGKFEAAVQRAEFYRNIFGPDFYLELQNHGSAKNQLAMDGLRAISRQTGIPLLVSQGAFYLDPADAAACNVLRQKNGNKPLIGEGYYLRSADEMCELFKDDPVALENTLRVADRCAFSGEL